MSGFRDKQGLSILIKITCIYNSFLWESLWGDQKKYVVQHQNFDQTKT